MEKYKENQNNCSKRTHDKVVKVMEKVSDTIQSKNPVNSSLPSDLNWDDEDDITKPY